MLLLIGSCTHRYKWGNLPPHNQNHSNHMQSESQVWHEERGSVHLWKVHTLSVEYLHVQRLQDPVRPEIFSLHTVLGYRVRWSSQAFTKTWFFRCKIPFKLQTIRLKLKNSLKMAFTLHKFHTWGALIWWMPIYGNIGDVRWERILPLAIFYRVKIVKFWFSVFREFVASTSSISGSRWRTYYQVIIVRFWFTFLEF